jgi:hypothetical protein
MNAKLSQSHTDGVIPAQKNLRLVFQKNRSKVKTLPNRRPVERIEIRRHTFSHEGQHKNKTVVK